MTQPADLACQVLRLEQQLQAYQKLHAEELGELWKVLNECKKAIADLAEERGGPAALRVGDVERDGGGKEARER